MDKTKSNVNGTQSWYEKESSWKQEFSYASRKTERKGNDPKMIAWLDRLCAAHRSKGSETYSFLDSIRQQYFRKGKISERQLYWLNKYDHPRER